MQIRILTATTLLTLCISATASAMDTLPARKAGIWEVKSTVGTSSFSMRACISGKGDQITNDFAGNTKYCEERVITKTSVGYKTHHRCKFGNNSIDNDMTIIGDFDKKLHADTTVIKTNRASPKSLEKQKYSVDMTWIGPCRSDQIPLDMIFNDKNLKLPKTP